ncbi:MAG TPA: hypothetical protein VN603_09365 [Candidatus Acidoferrales bacterium]|nr:hypothetical protein [Candidatus Acidoferrales bacterium]
MSAGADKGLGGFLLVADTTGSAAGPQADVKIADNAPAIERT